MKDYQNSWGSKAMPRLKDYKPTQKEIREMKRLKKSGIQYDEIADIMDIPVAKIWSTFSGMKLNVNKKFKRAK